MISRVLVGNRFGELIGEIEPEIGSITDILNAVGSTELALSASDPKCNEKYLRLGNTVYIEFDNGLSPWGGFLGLPRTWSVLGVMTTCYTIDKLLKSRYTGKNDYFDNVTAGEIFERYIEYVESKSPVGLRVGNVWKGGEAHWVRFHYRSLWDVLDYSLRQMERCDFQFVPYLEGSRILFRANFQQEIGADKSDSLAFVEENNAGSTLEFTEAGTLINSFTAVGEGSTWGPERITRTVRDRESIAKYGLREGAEVSAGISDESTLLMQARNALKLQSEPRRLFTLPVTNNKPAEFSTYRLGDTLSCYLSSFGFQGFDGKVRILARDINAATGECTLAVQEPRTPDYWIYGEDSTAEEEQ